MSDVLTRKKELRRLVLGKRRSLLPAERDRASRAIFAALCQEDYFRRAGNIFAYAAMADEVQTLELLRFMLEEGKSVFLPYIEQKRIMRPVQLKSMDALVAGQYGILTVDAGQKEFIAPQKLDCILVPGVAFDRQGNRLGMGGGYYDTLLPQASQAVRLALAYDCQLVEDIPCESHDCRMDKIITDKEIIICKS